MGKNKNAQKTSLRQGGSFYKGQPLLKGNKS